VNVLLSNLIRGARYLAGFGQQNRLLEGQSANSRRDPPLTCGAACSLVMVCGLLTVKVLPWRRIRPPPVALWFFPVLSILTVAGIVAVLVQMAFDSSARTHFLLSLLSWAVVVALYFLTQRWREHATATDG